jgi:hypothetical protein
LHDIHWSRHRRDCDGCGRFGGTEGSGNGLRHVWWLDRLSEQSLDCGIYCCLLCGGTPLDWGTANGWGGNPQPNQDNHTDNSEDG